MQALKGRPAGLQGISARLAGLRPYATSDSVSLRKEVAVAQEEVRRAAAQEAVCRAAAQEAVATSGRCS